MPTAKEIATAILDQEINRKGVHPYTGKPMEGQVSLRAVLAHSDRNIEYTIKEVHDRELRRRSHHANGTPMTGTTTLAAVSGHADEMQERLIAAIVGGLDATALAKALARSWRRRSWPNWHRSPSP